VLHTFGAMDSWNLRAGARRMSTQLNDKMRRHRILSCVGLMLVLTVSAVGAFQAPHALVRRHASPRCLGSASATSRRLRLHPATLALSMKGKVRLFCVVPVRVRTAHAVADFRAVRSRAARREPQ